MCTSNTLVTCDQCKTRFDPALDLCDCPLREIPEGWAFHFSRGTTAEKTWELLYSSPCGSNTRGTFVLRRATAPVKRWKLLNEVPEGAYLVKQVR